MKKIIIYTKENCPYCIKAKKLLEKKHLSYEEIDVTGQDEMREKLVELSGGRKTVPQIFIGDYHVGGCDDLYAMEEEGELDKLLV
ncbi:MAG: glutaredoxin 3 [Rickettsiaceae bacterium]|nr:glutaredoxin 3 [Rickettsiaceae bacterium]